MGTRHLICVVADNQFKVSNYGQWDGYIGGQGIDTLKFLRDTMNPDFREKVSQCSWITPEEHKQMWVDCGADPESDMVTMDVSDKFKEKYPWLHRDCGSDIFNYIQNSETGLKLTDSTSFAADSLFCEYAYVVDFDKNTFEVYQGFNQSPLTENDRFYSIQKPNSEYYPVKMVKSYSLNELPTDEQFFEDFKEPDEE